MIKQQVPATLESKQPGVRKGSALTLKLTPSGSAASDGRTQGNSPPVKRPGPRCVPCLTWHQGLQAPDL